jgi:hypothetical protein
MLVSIVLISVMNVVVMADGRYSRDRHDLGDRRAGKDFSAATEGLLGWGPRSGRSVSRRSTAECLEAQFGLASGGAWCSFDRRADVVTIATGRAEALLASLQPA